MRAVPRASQTNVRAPLLLLSSPPVKVTRLLMLACEPTLNLAELGAEAVKLVTRFWLGVVLKYTLEFCGAVVLKLKFPPFMAMNPVSLVGLMVPFPVMERLAPKRFREAPERRTKPPPELPPTKSV